MICNRNDVAPVMQTEKEKSISLNYNAKVPTAKLVENACFVSLIHNTLLIQ